MHLLMLVNAQYITYDAAAVFISDSDFIYPQPKLSLMTVHADGGCLREDEHAAPRSVGVVQSCHDFQPKSDSTAASTAAAPAEAAPAMAAASRDAAPKHVRTHHEDV